MFYEILLGSEQLQITRKRRQNNMKKRTILLAFIISAVAMTSGCSANEPKTDEVKQEQTKTESVSSGVTIKPLTQKAIDENPYMAKNDANIHHACWYLPRN